MISERDYNNILATAREEGLKMGHEEGYDKGHAKGLAEGRAEGREEGREEGRIDIAKKMKASTISEAIIADCTGLTLEQVKEL